MSAPGTTTRRPGATKSQIRQLPSHARLLRDVSHRFTPARRGRLDAIIVPTARPASALAGLVELAASLGTLLVVLCSKHAAVEQVKERVGRTPRARALVIDMSEGYRLPVPVAFETSADLFAKSSGGRASDLSLKRNFGLLLAKAMGWTKIAFVDDDITLSCPDVTKISYHLENHGVVGMACRDFPDNSVFCHARRLAKLPQDVFVTGAVLGVNCASPALPFFPDIYNEDWFFFGEAAARHRLTKAGEARQAEYEPFADLTRAVHEEFGDLLAEGLYALVEDLGPSQSFRQATHRATDAYWSSFIDVRRSDLVETQDLLGRFVNCGSDGDNVEAAIKSLDAAEEQYREEWITADQCVQFLEAWEWDTVRWGRVCSSLNGAHTVSSAMERLQVTNWDRVR